MQRSLCSRCESLDIISDLITEREAVPANGKRVVSLGKRSQKPKCGMCRFFLDLSPIYKRDYVQHVRLFDRIRQSTQSPDFQTMAKLSRTRFLSVLRENSRLQYNYKVQDEITQSGIVVYLPRDPLPLPFSPVRFINTATVDFGLLRSLIKHCQVSHAKCEQTEDRHSLPYIYLIDCVEDKIVRDYSGQGYLALSYVWGQSSQVGSQVIVGEEWPDGTFSFSKAPLTVRDAIRVVRNLGRRYLWVDKYCINQANEMEKKAMMQNMNLIYEGAEATIVAMFGENDGAGLPGVSEIFRTPQSQFQTPHGSLLSSCPPISTVVNTSKWATRGWTYQEARLSRRCLFFTEHQVYVVCREATGSEAVPSQSRSCSISSLLNFSRIGPALFAPNASIAYGFCLDRLAFSQRALTNESDALNAFRGVLNRSPFITFWGVPIVPLEAAMDPHVGFALGFLWTRRPDWSSSRHFKPSEPSPRIRRANFPTWSWASVTGEIWNQVYGRKSVLGAYLKADRHISSDSDAYIRFWIDVGSQKVPLHEAIQQHSNMLVDESPFLLVEGDLVQVTCSKGNQLYHIPGFSHSSPMFWAVLDLDQDLATDGAQTRVNSYIEDALILVDCIDGLKNSKKRLVLMLLRWVGNGVAERKGLLSEYRIEHDAEEVRRLQRTRRSFILQ